MNWLYYVLVVISIFVSFAIIMLILIMHDEQIETEQDVSSASCSYLKDFLIEQEPLYFKHPWYDLAVKKVNSDECK